MIADNQARGQTLFYSMPIDQTENFRREAADALSAQFEQAEPGRAQAMRAEVNEIMRGNFRGIEFELDPLTAWHLAGALDLALSHPAFPPATRATLDLIYDGLADRIAPQFPELARQLAISRRQRREAI